MFVYCLVVHKDNKVKIGVSRDISKRIKQLPYRFDLRESFYVYVGKDYCKIESSLHTLLDSFRVSMDKGDGYTEFFEKRAADHAKKILEISGKVIESFTDEDVKQEQKREVQGMELYVMGKMIKEARLSRNMSQQSLADSCGLSRVTVNTAEVGLYSITLKNLIPILDELDLSLQIHTQ